MRYTDMSYEIIEAIKNYYDEDEDTLIECLVYLRNHLSSSAISNMAKELVDKNICPWCGTDLIVKNEIQAHIELSEVSKEYFTYKACPSCGLEWG